jgi:hypothetical protein
MRAQKNGKFRKVVWDQVWVQVFELSYTLFTFKFNEHIGLYVNDPKNVAPPNG